MDAASASVFQLYQPGLAPDHVLQLCYLRRRAPRRQQPNQRRIEDEFVLPRPEFKVAEILPAVDIPLQQLVAASSAQETRSYAATETPSETALKHAKETARRHFLQPRRAAAEDVRQWAALTASDWLQIHHEQEGEDDDMTGLAPLPDMADVCWLLKQCPSDGLVGFVWGHLLLSLLQQSDGCNAKETQRLLSLLANHHSLASLSPKDFRAKVRARNLRQVGDVGAQAELALIALYREQRDCAK